MIHHRSSCQSHAPARRPRAELISVALRRLFVWSDVSIRPSDASALSVLFCSEPSVVLSRSFLVLLATGLSVLRPKQAGSGTRNLFQPEVGPPPSDSDWFMR